MRGVTAAAAATDERLVLKEKATQIYEEKNVAETLLHGAEWDLLLLGCWWQGWLNFTFTFQNNNNNGYEDDDDEESKIPSNAKQRSVMLRQWCVLDEGSLYWFLFPRPNIQLRCWQWARQEHECNRGLPKVPNSFDASLSCASFRLSVQSKNAHTPKIYRLHYIGL